MCRRVLVARCRTLPPTLRTAANNSNNILYSSQREIKAVVRSHNEEHVSIIQSHETHAHTRSWTYAPVSLNLRTLIANPKITWNDAFYVKPKRKNSQIKYKSLGSHIPNPPLESYHPQQTS